MAIGTICAEKPLIFPSPVVDRNAFHETSRTPTRIFETRLQARSFINHPDAEKLIAESLPRRRAEVNGEFVPFFSRSTKIATVRWYSRFKAEYRTKADADKAAKVWMEAGMILFPERLKTGRKQEAQSRQRCGLTERHQSIVLRPYGERTTFIQLNDLNYEQLKPLAPVACLIIETSPGNRQAWTAVSDLGEDDAKEFARRLRKGDACRPKRFGRD